MGDLPDFTQAIAGISVQQVQNAFVNPSTIVDVSSWNSIIVRMGSLSGTDTLVLSYQFLAADGTTILDSGIFACGTPGEVPAWTLPVTGPKFKIINSTGQTLMVGQVYGSNVQANKRMQYDYNPVRSLLAVVPNATPSLTTTLLPDQWTDPMVQNATSYNGAITLIWNFASLGGATSWHLLIEYLTEDGTAHLTQIAATAAVGQLTIAFGHPFAFTRWFIQNVGATTSQINVTLLIIPTENT